MDEVFVSYARSEAAVIDPIVAQLRAGGVGVWLDRSDIQVSVPWLDEITQAIRGASLLLVCESLAWHSSANCGVEVHTARELQKHLVWVDANSQPAAEIVTTVSRALSEVPAEERLRAELLQRSHRWSLDGRRGGQLARGRSLRAYRRLIAASDKAIDAESRRFVQASQRRIRRQAVASSVASLALSAIVALPQVVTKTQKLVETRTDATMIQRYERLQTQQRGAVSGYLATQEALALSADGADVFWSRQSLVDALSLSLPDRVTRGAHSIARGAAQASPAKPPMRVAAPAGGNVAVVDTRPASVRVLDHSGALYRRFWFDGAVGAVAWSPSGRLLAVADASGVEVLDVLRGSRRARLRGAEREVTALRWSDGERSLVGTTRSALDVHWSMVDSTVVDADPRRWYMDLAVNSGGRMAALSRDGSVTFVDPVHQTPIRTLTTVGIGDGRAVTAAGDRWLVAKALNGNGRLVLIDLAGHQNAVELPGCDARGVVGRTGTSEAVVACGVAGYATVDLDARTAELHESTTLVEVTNLGENKGQVVLAGSSFDLVELLPDGTESNIQFGNHLCPSTSTRIAFVPNRREFFTAGAGTGGGCAEHETQQSPRSWHRDAVLLVGLTDHEARGLAISRDGTMAAYGFSDGLIRVFDPRSMNPLLITRPSASEIRGLTFTSDGSALVAITRDGDILSIPTAQARATIAELRQLARHRLDLGIASGLYHPPPNAGGT
jgi:hypothetical protein